MYYSVAKGDRLEDAAKNADIVTMGINPSRKELHHGHFFTMHQAMRAVLEREETRGLFFVDDREYHFPKDRHEKEEFRFPREDAVDAVERQMKAFIAQIAEELGVSGLPKRIRVQRMSEYYSWNKGEGPQGLRLYTLLVHNQERIRRALEFLHEREGQREIIRPVCPRCERGPCEESRIRLETERIRSRCERDMCLEKGAYTINVGTGEANWGMHYCVDPLRDILESEDSGARVLHIFGGDYGEKWGSSGTPKAERLSRLIPQMRPHARVDHFIGKLLVDPDGKKLAKSSGHSSQPLSGREIDEILAARGAVIVIQPQTNGISKPQTVFTPLAASSPKTPPPSRPQPPVRAPAAPREPFQPLPPEREWEPQLLLGVLERITRETDGGSNEAGLQDILRELRLPLGDYRLLIEQQGRIRGAVEAGKTLFVLRRPIPSGGSGPRKKMHPRVPVYSGPLRIDPSKDDSLPPLPPEEERTLEQTVQYLEGQVAGIQRRIEEMRAVLV